MSRPTWDSNTATEGFCYFFFFNSRLREFPLSSGKREGGGGSFPLKRGRTSVSLLGKNLGFNIAMRKRICHPLICSKRTYKQILLWPNLHIWFCQKRYSRECSALHFLQPRRHTLLINPFSRVDHPSLSLPALTVNPGTLHTSDKHPKTEPHWLP